MPRYQRGRDWVEIAGAARRSMGELRVIWQADEAAAHGVLDELVVRGQFVDRHGVAWEFTPTLPSPLRQGGRPWDHLTLQQYDWVRDRVYQAGRDEALDPGSW